MCTAVSVFGDNAFFGRTLDVGGSYGERIIVIPRSAPIILKYRETLTAHYAMVGTGLLRDERVLYFDAVNEHGLAAAGLNFPRSAAYTDAVPGAINVPSYEIIPWLLSLARSVGEAAELLRNVRITGDSASPDMPPTPLHFIISDKERSITVEPLSSGLKVTDNPYGVLTNEPPFDYHVHHLADFMCLDNDMPRNRIAPNTPIPVYSRGLGAIGLPGDYSSASRFVRAVFVKNHAQIDTEDAVNGFFRILDSVSVPYGCVASEGEAWGTVYASCMDMSDPCYYFTSRTNRCIRAFPLRAHELMLCEPVILDPYVGDGIVYPYRS